MTQPASKIGTSGKRPKTGGRQKGSTNKVTGSLRQAIMEAARETGSNGRGLGGLKGYLKKVAREDAKTFAGLLGRIIPLQVGGDPDGVPIVTRILEEIVDPKK